MESQVHYQRTRYHRSGAEGHQGQYDTQSYYDDKTHHMYPKKFGRHEKENVYLNKNNLANRAREPRDELPWEPIAHNIDGILREPASGFHRDSSNQHSPHSIELQTSYKEDRPRPPKKYQKESSRFQQTSFVPRLVHFENRLSTVIFVLFENKRCLIFSR